MMIDLYKTGMVGKIQWGGGLYKTVLNGFKVYFYREQNHGVIRQGLRGIRGIGVRAFGARAEFWAWTLN